MCNGNYYQKSYHDHNRLLDITSAVTDRRRQHHTGLIVSLGNSYCTILYFSLNNPSSNENELGELITPGAAVLNSCVYCFVCHDDPLR